MGLYFKFSIVLFYIPILAIYFIIKKFYTINNIKIIRKKIKLLSIKRYFRYIKLILTPKVFFYIIIFSVISNSIVIFQNQKYNNLYKDKQNISGEGIIISNSKETEYHYLYKIKLLHANNRQYKNMYFYLRINKKSTENIQYGDKVNFNGQFIEPTSKRNYGGFNYKEYLKTLKIHGNIKVDIIEVIEKDSENPIFSFANQISVKIKQKIDTLMRKEIASLVKGILLGDNSEIEEAVEENFRISNISHILAVSGLHVSYTIIGIHLLFQPMIGKRRTRFIIIIFLIFYMFITGFSASIVRASIMGILAMGAEILYRKNDIWTSIAISLGVILIYNPFLITNIGLQFSYLGTSGIILFHKNVLKIFESIKFKNKKRKYRFNREITLLAVKIKEILSVSISAQLAIFPIMIYHFNLLGIYFFITNLLVSIIIGPIIILSSLAVIFSLIWNPLAQVSSSVLEILVQMLIIISNLSKLPFAKIYLPTPKIPIIILYYFFILISNNIYSLYHTKKLNYTQIRIRNLIALVKYKAFLNKKIFLKIFFTTTVSFIFLITFIPKKLNIHFVDVGQGDCTFIVTPNNKTILIDGGGSSSNEFDVGKSTLLPYILDRGYTRIDTIFISHFDQDHVQGLLYVMKEIKVKNIIIGKQFESSENYNKFLDIIKDKKIKVKVVEEKSKINIEKNLCFDILWPSSNNAIQENSINNNALVCKLKYKNFSMMFTGDIEEEAEKVLIEKYKNTNYLKSTILKVAHHGSKSSSTQEFLDLVKPKISLTGVGKDNKFGHPSDEVVSRLNALFSKIYRTDNDGEISIVVNRKGIITKINKCVE